MSTQTNTIQDDIILLLNVKIDEALNDFDDIIAEKKKECEEGIVPNAAAVYEPYIRNIRRRVFYQLNGIKAWIGTHIRSVIIQQVKTSGIHKLHKIKKTITSVEAERRKALEEKRRILKNDDSLSDFEKYSLYGHPEFNQFKKSDKKNRRTKNANSSVREISPNIELAYQKYKSKKKSSLMIGLIVTPICILIDFSMIYSLFLSANYPPGFAMIIAVISAAMLDAPPYVFGCLWTKSDDDNSLFELQGNADTPEARRKNKGDKILLTTVLVVIIIAFIAYLSVRVLSFLGGGDFNLAFHALIEKKWDIIKSAEFSGADFLSIIVPVATSVVSLAVGKMFYSLKTDYIKASIIIIKDEINRKIKKCDDKIVDCEKQIKDLKDSMAILKKEIWTFYLGRSPFPSDDDVFRLEVSRAFQRLNLPLYEQTYLDCCLLLRNQAITLLGTVNEQLAQYAADHSGIINMSFSPDEEQCLDDFWVVSTDNMPQHSMTQSHLDSISNTVDDILNMLG